MRSFVSRRLSMILLTAMLHSARCEEMTEEQIAAAREEALCMLDKPLEKMKMKELLEDCHGAKKGEVVQQVVAYACKVIKQLDACACITACASAQR
jgi:uncharacterized protein YgbK (DUF1537 family)